AITCGRVPAGFKPRWKHAWYAPGSSVQKAPNHLLLAHVHADAVPADLQVDDIAVQWVKSDNLWRRLLRQGQPWVVSIRPEPAEHHAVLQRPAAALVVEREGAEHERLPAPHLGVAQPSLADPHAPVPAHCR
uniref:Uncharacterized protein n=1 Tax=Triticum urartu TaxID=4572 RepID=A0A8R7REM1_TRIUA